MLPQSRTSTRDRSYEDTQPSGAGAIVFVAILLGTLVTVGAVVGIDYWRLRSATGVAEQYPPAPQLQPRPSQDLGDYVHRSEAWLNGSGWVDRAHGVTHVPVDRAKELVLKEGVQSP